MTVKKANYVKINYENILSNIENIKKMTNKDIFACVKNDAYNFGLGKIVKILLENDSKYFALTTIDEAVQIKNISRDAYVLMFNTANDEEIEIARKYKIALALSSMDFLKRNIKKLDGIELHLKINIGMNRFGFNNLEEIKEAMIIVKENNLNLTGLYAHYPLSDEKDLRGHNKMIDDFLEYYDYLSKVYDFKYIHSENSSAILLNDEKLNFCTHTRPGILIYGYSPSIKADFLKPSFYLYTKVVDIREIKKGDSLGYGNSFKAPKDMKIAVLAIGYGDGILRIRRKLPMYIDGRAYKIISNIFMSHSFLEIDDKVKVGDRVEVYGDNIKIDDMAKRGYAGNAEQLSCINISRLLVE